MPPLELGEVKPRNGHWHPEHSSLTKVSFHPSYAVPWTNTYLGWGTSTAITSTMYAFHYSCISTALDQKTMCQKASMSTRHTPLINSVPHIGTTTQTV